MARPGTGGGGGGRYAKLGVLVDLHGGIWDKQDITPRTRKIPYLISSSYSGNILYTHVPVKTQMQQQKSKVPVWYYAYAIVRWYELFSGQ